MKFFYLFVGLFTFQSLKAQEVECIYFNLYTDSLKKGVHNYINVDGKLSNGKFKPLNSNSIEFSSNAGKWEGNNLIIDPSFTGESVVVKAYFKPNPELSKSIVIYLKKNIDDTPLKTEAEILRQIRKS